MALAGDTTQEIELSAGADLLADVQYAHGRRVDLDGWTLHVGGTSANRLENVVNAFAINGVETYFGAFELGVEGVGGVVYEGVGIPPDIELLNDPDVLAGGTDEVLEAAMALF